MHRVLLVLLVPVVLIAALGCAPPLPEGAVPVTVTPGVVATVDERFLSFAIDSSQVVGGLWWSADPQDVEGGLGTVRTAPFDFTRPRLRELTSALAPATLRIGGSEADRLVYEVSGADVDDPDALILTRAQWAGVMEFASALDLDVLFTLNAGPTARGADGAWLPSSARALLADAAARGDPVTTWELGNEINGFALIHGPEHRVSGEQYARDVAAARALVDEVTPNRRLAGPSSAFWPVWGEVAPVMPSFFAAGGAALLDVITWHYYPQQSARCPIAVRRAEPDTLTTPDNLDEVAVWAAEVEQLRDAHAPGVTVALGETGHAQCGGEPGVSTTIASSLWWLDQLGQIARRGQPFVIRQTLAGSDYGLLDENTLDPRPDYWASVLWRQNMSARVIGADVDHFDLRAWAHCAPGGGTSLLVINLHPTEARTIALDVDATDATMQRVAGADGLLAATVALEGRPLVDNAGALPDLSGAVLPRSAEGPAFVELAAASYAFVRLPNVACE